MKYIYIYTNIQPYILAVIPLRLQKEKVKGHHTAGHRYIFTHSLPHTTGFPAQTVDALVCVYVAIGGLGGEHIRVEVSQEGGGANEEQ